MKDGQNASSLAVSLEFAVSCREKLKVALSDLELHGDRRLE
jgi:hypothetical protein